MEYASGGLFVPEGSIPTIGWKNKTNDDYEGRIMGISWHKGTKKNTGVPDFVSGFQYLKRKDKRGCDEHID